MHCTNDELTYSRCVTGHCFNLLASNVKHISMDVLYIIRDRDEHSNAAVTGVCLRCHRILCIDSEWRKNFRIMSWSSLMKLCEQHASSMYFRAHAHFGQNGDNAIKVFKLN